MKSTDDLIRSIVGDWGAHHSLVRKSSTWYGQGADATLLVNVQKSQYGPKRYLNLGLVIRELDQDQFPKIQSSHIQCRLEDLATERKGEILALLDLESSTASDVRSLGLRDALEECVAPLIGHGTSYSGWPEDVFRKFVDASLVNVEAHDLITRFMAPM